MPDVLDAIDFHGTDTVRDLISAGGCVAPAVCRGCTECALGRTDVVRPARWRGYLDAAAEAGDATAYRHYWELCVLYGLRDGLRTGDVHVPGSRRYADPTGHLMAPERWQLQRGEYCSLVGKPPDGRDALALARDELHAALGDLEQVLADGNGPVRLGDDGESSPGSSTSSSGDLRTAGGEDDTSTDIC